MKLRGEANIKVDFTVDLDEEYSIAYNSLLDLFFEDDYHWIEDIIRSHWELDKLYISDIINSSNYASLTEDSVMSKYKNLFFYFEKIGLIKNFNKKRGSYNVVDSREFRKELKKMYEEIGNMINHGVDAARRDALIDYVTD